MAEIFRSRDCVVLVKDDAYTVSIDDELATLGWPGGQGVKWTNAAPDDEFRVTFSDGPYAGFLVWGSDEAGDDHAATSRNQPHYRFATLLAGSALIMTSSYERYTLASRITPPLVPLVYGVNDRLYFSLRGLWTIEDEQTLSSGPFAPAPSAGFVAQVPKSLNNLFLGVQTAI